jgi:hypothetical protein
MTRDELIAKVREVAARLGKTKLTFKEFRGEAGIAVYWMHNTNSR